MKTVSDTEFQEQYLSLLDSVPADGVLITKEGRPVARLLPVALSCADLIGSIKDLTMDTNDTLLSTGIQWDAQS